jgi:protein-tyrosine phosphatase
MSISPHYHTSARRHIPVQGAHNIRDLGGYQTTDGRQTRWRTLLRADGLHALPESSQSALIDIGVNTVIDLRGSRELVDTPNVFEGSPKVDYRSHNVTGDELINSWVGGPIPDDSSVRLSSFYTTILDNRGDAIRATLETIGEPGSLPVLFHCTAGKDRTGVLAALLLGIAGVPTQTIIDDYVLSARFLYGSAVVPPDGSGAGELPPFDEYQAKWSPPGAMALTLGHLDEKYGGIEGYVRHVGLTESEISTIKNSFVE